MVLGGNASKVGNKVSKVAPADRSDAFNDGGSVDPIERDGKKVNKVAPEDRSFGLSAGIGIALGTSGKVDKKVSKVAPADRSAEFNDGGSVDPIEREGKKVNKVAPTDRDSGTMELVGLINQLQGAADAGASAGQEIGHIISQMGAMAANLPTNTGSEDSTVVGVFSIAYAEATFVASLNMISMKCPEVERRVDYTLAMVESTREMLHDLKNEEDTDYMFTRSGVRRMEAAQVAIAGFTD